jgi:hypothetical protein
MHILLEVRVCYELLVTCILLSQSYLLDELQLIVYTDLSLIRQRGLGVINDIV